MKKFYAGKILAGYCIPVCLALQAQAAPVLAATFQYDINNTDAAPHYLDEPIWSTAGAPATGDVVHLIAETSEDSPIVFFRYTDTTPSFPLIRVDNLGTGTTSLWSSTSISTPLLTSASVYIGTIGRGAFKLQTTAVQSVRDSMHLGYNAGATGTYTMTGGTLQATDSAFNLYAGRGGAGAFNQNAGTVNLGTGSLHAGYNSTSTGSYNLSGTGSLTAAYETIGNQGTGTFTQSGGTNSISSTLYLGEHAGATGTYNLTGGTLQNSDGALSMYIGSYGSGIFNQSGGSVDLGSAYLNIAYNGGEGTYNLSNGTLNAYAINNYDTFTQSGGTLEAAYFYNHGTFSYSGGDFNGRLYLYEEGSFSYGTEFTAGNGIRNDDFFTIYSGRTVNADGQGLDNNNQLTLYGTLGGDGRITNDGRIYAAGTITGSGGLVNNAVFEQTGDLTISKSGLIENKMFFTLGSQDFLTLSGGNFENSGAMTMDSSIINGSATLINKAGGTLKGDGLIKTSFSNEGRLLVTGNTNVSSAFTNSGIVEMAGAAADLGGGTMTNTGTIHGLGQVANSIVNSGMIEALNGTLTLSGAVTNSAAGQMSAGSGSKLMMGQGLAVNNGRITLQGGTFDNNGQVMTSNSRITGYGALRTGGLTNEGSVLLAGGSSTVDGQVTNSTAGTIEVAHGHATFNDAVINNGLFKTTEASVSFASAFTNNGTYFSDPSLQTFTDLLVETNGALIGLEAGDIFRVSGDFFNYSTNNEGWNTMTAWLEFTTGAGGDNHVMSLAGADLGAALAGYRDNFAWGRLDLTGNSLNIFDGNNLQGGGFYVGSLLGLEVDTENKLIGNITGIADLNIYYLAGLDENAYLGGLDYDLLNGGQLIAVAGDTVPTPVPGAFWLLGSGMAGLMAYRRRLGK